MHLARKCQCKSNREWERERVGRGKERLCENVRFCVCRNAISQRCDLFANKTENELVYSVECNRFRFWFQIHLIAGSWWEIMANIISNQKPPHSTNTSTHNIFGQRIQKISFDCCCVYLPKAEQLKWNSHGRAHFRNGFMYLVGKGHLMNVYLGSLQFQMNISTNNISNELVNEQTYEANAMQYA